MKTEASLLLTYAMSASGLGWRPGVAEEQTYERALRMQVAQPHQLDPLVFDYPVLLGGLDVMSRLLYPGSILQQKLIIALALVEYHPASAPWLLPKDRNLFSWTWSVARLCLRIGLKLLVGALLFPFRGFFLRNVGPV
jgi:hypothetical protein